MVDLDVRRLEILRELAARGTVTATAEALHMTTSAVSQQLAALSRQVGAPMLEPDGRRVRLTEAARILLGHAEAVISRLEAAQADLAAYLHGSAGQIRIAAFATGIRELVLPSVGLLARERPGLAVRIQEADPEQALRRLAAGDVDIALSLEAQDAPPAQDQRFDQVVLLLDPLDLALPVGHPLAGAAGVRLADLVGDQWIFGRGGPWHAITLAACAAAGFTPEIAHEAEGWPTILAMIAAGLGVALVPRLANAAHTPGVVVRELSADQPRRHVVAVTRRGTGLAPHIAPMLTALRRTAEQLPG
ncbi:LysR family transcriptional regulator [Streptacidiphilus sp. EB129]|uniref:LysR family transcriptional regulator n=1 Tax=Streptacidiphilus sp. EB129 TaxID=3156262 RepID=UPI0035112FC0